MIWPSPEAVSLKVIAGESRIEIPIRAADANDVRLAPFDAVEGAPLAETMISSRQIVPVKLFYDLAV